MPGIVYALEPSQPSCEAGATVPLSSEIREPRHGQVMYLAQGDTLLGGRARTQPPTVRPWSPSCQPHITQIL